MIQLGADDYRTSGERQNDTPVDTGYLKMAKNLGTIDAAIYLIMLGGNAAPKRKRI
ncbi:hypothetical protein ccbrp13_33980 [Ktedonobacteria bacterium brp13]|nr:hypothetical protein ccbrp13_33980 [Ktedonobacteria bacterium brp13]